MIRTKKQIKKSPDSERFMPVRISRTNVANFKQLAEERDIRFYGNLMNEVLEKYANGELVEH